MPALEEKKHIWKDYYACRKPRCLNCQQQGINENEYKFCSTEKQPVTIYDQWGRQVIHIFKDIYACNVYHWTVYQGQNKVKQDNKQTL